MERVLAILAELRWMERLRRISEGPVSTSLTLGATDAAAQLGIGVSFAIPASEDALTYLTEHLNALSVGIQNTTTAEVRALLEQALRDGLTNAQTRAKLGELFDGYQDWRLDRISRTETRAAYNLGALKQYRDAGVTFVRVIDGDDPLCADWNGRTVPLHEAEGSPLGHPNCRRTWVPITTDLGRPPVLDAAKPAAAKAPEFHLHIDPGAFVNNITTPPVTVPAAQITVEPVTVTVEGPAPGKTVRTVKRDRTGHITQIVEE